MLYFSDHCFMECGLSIQHPALMKEAFSYLKYKSIDIDLFKLDILSSNLHAEEWLNVNKLQVVSVQYFLMMYS